MRGVDVYCHPWHLERSDAFRDLLAPLQDAVPLRFIAWDGTSAVETPITTTTVFCQSILAPAQIAAYAQHLVWIPMWDSEQFQPQQWWNSLPKALRVIAFSQAVYARAQKAGLRVMRVHYHKDPDTLEPVTWSQGRVLHYWNRTGLVGPDVLARMCEALRVDRLLFRAEVDSDSFRSLAYSLPQRLGSTTVELVPLFATRNEYLQATRDANIFIAPRASEGVGMTFLEPLARGAAVFANDRATMNESITSGEDGFLFRRLWTLQRGIRLVRAQLARRGLGVQPSSSHLLNTQEQDWQAIAALDLEQIGLSARSRQKAGYALWESEAAAYVHFVLDDV